MEYRFRVDSFVQQLQTNSALFGALFDCVSHDAQKDVHGLLTADIDAGLQYLNALAKERADEAGLGSLADKSVRMGQLCWQVSRHTGADDKQALRAGEICKIDLSSQVVSKFPDLHGWVVALLAEHAEESEEVCEALSKFPRIAGGSTFSSPSDLALTLAIADSLDDLLGLWITKLPNKDNPPSGHMRFAAMQLIDLICRFGVKLPLVGTHTLADHDIPGGNGIGETMDGILLDHLMVETDDFIGVGGLSLDTISERAPIAVRTLMTFLRDCLQAHLTARGVSPSICKAVLNLPEPNLARLAERARVLDWFAKTEDGAQFIKLYHALSQLVGDEFEDKGTPQRDLENGSGPILDRMQQNFELAIEADDFKAAILVLSDANPVLESMKSVPAAKRAAFFYRLRRIASMIANFEELVHEQV